VVDPSTERRSLAIWSAIEAALVAGDAGAAAAGAAVLGLEGLQGAEEALEAVFVPGLGDFGEGVAEIEGGDDESVLSRCAGGVAPYILDVEADVETGAQVDFAATLIGIELFEMFDGEVSGTADERVWSEGRGGICSCGAWVRGREGSSAGLGAAPVGEIAI
jgi:hypothetical protein